jgi:hypothetical protein
MNGGCYLGTANLQKMRSAEGSLLFIVEDSTNLRGSKSRRRSRSRYRARNVAGRDTKP